MTRRTRPAAPAIAAAVLAVAAGCVQEPSRGPEPLRRADTSEEQAYLACVGADPLFRTERCRRLRASLSSDPSPGLFGR